MNRFKVLIYQNDIEVANYVTDDIKHSLLLATLMSGRFMKEEMKTTLIVHIVHNNKYGYTISAILFPTKEDIDNYPKLKDLSSADKTKKAKWLIHVTELKEKPMFSKDEAILVTNDMIVESFTTLVASLMLVDFIK